MSPKQTPDSALYRTVKANDGAGPHTDRAKGLNCGGYEQMSIEVIPDAADNPVVAVLYWSETAERFVAHEPAIGVAAKGAGVPYVMTVPVLGRIIFVQVTSGIAALSPGTLIAVGGFNILHPD